MSNPLLGGLDHPPPYTKPRCPPPQPITSHHFVCFSLHYDAFFSFDSHFFLYSYRAFVGESLQFANFLGDILPLRVRVRVLFGVGV